MERLLLGASGCWNALQVSKRGRGAGHEGGERATERGESQSWGERRKGGRKGVSVVAYQGSSMLKVKNVWRAFVVGGGEDNRPN